MISPLLDAQSPVRASASAAIARLLASTSDIATLRAWVPGCGGGEDAYALAMLLHEQRSLARRQVGFRVFATDADPAAIHRARRGLLRQAFGSRMPRAARERYLASDGAEYRVSREIRGSILFTVDERSLDCPFTRLDLVYCSDEAATAVGLAALHLALKPEGLLVLAAPAGDGDLDGFERHRGKGRVYRKTSRPASGRLLPTVADPARRPPATDPGRERRTNEELRAANDELASLNAELRDELRRLHEVRSELDHLLDAADIGTVFLDRQLCVRSFNARACETLPLGPSDVHGPLKIAPQGLQVAELVRLARDVLHSGTPEERRLLSVAGRALLLRVAPHRARRGPFKGVVLTFVDITETLRVQRRLAHSEEQFRQLAENIPDVFWMTNPARRELLYVSPRFEAVFGYPVPDLYRDPTLWERTIAEEDRERACRLFEEHRSGYDVEYRIRRGDGEIRWIRARAFPVRDEEGVAYRVAGIASDVTERKRTVEQICAMSAELEAQANNDPLTGLLNRRGFEKALTREIERSRTDGTVMAAALVDCDEFKTVNDRLGHAVGDHVLQVVARRAKTSVRPGDVVARIGGDEFLILLPNTRFREALQVGERLRLAFLDGPLRLAGGQVRVTVSIGVTEVRSDVMSIEEVLNAAHGALARGKRDGKNRVTGERPTDDEHEALPGTSVAELLLDGDGVRVHSQSIRRIADGAVVGFELLSRGPRGTYERPQDFLRASMEQNVLTPVDLLCLRSCIERASRDPGLRWHVNILPSTLLDTPQELLRGLFRGAGDPHRFCVEISEQQFIGDPACIEGHVAALRQTGVAIAIDDLGFGRSSLESLIVLHPEVVKIDRRLVHGLANDAGKQRSLGRLLRIVDCLDAEIVAEGVETPQDLQRLRVMGVPLAQGFLWDHPVEVSPARPEVAV